MPNRRCLGLIALALALGFAPRAAHAQDSAGGLQASAAPPKAAELVRYVAPEPLVLAPGATGEVKVTFVVLEPWHVNAHVPHEDFLVPTALTIPGAAGVSAGTPRYPAPRDVQLAFSETPLAVYEGEFAVVVPIRVAADAAPGTRTLTGRLSFQSCNDQVCLPPMRIPVTLMVLVAGTPVAGAIAAPPESTASTASAAPADSAAAGTVATPGGAFDTGPPKGAAAGGAGVAGNAVGRWFDERGSFLAFLFIFLMGLALNLTPCVYPMMGVTVSLFGAQAGADGAAGRGGALRALPKASIYVLGIALMYSTLGVVAAMTGGLFGGWLSSPWVLAGIGFLLLAMALSMFGVYELQVPSGIVSRLGGAAGAGYLGTFLAGLLVGVFAAPCIGPPIIALLAHVGAKGDPVFGFWAFFVLSLGLGLPYLVLGVSTGLLAKLPRSGSWMDWVKHLFGVILVGVAAFYLCLAFAPSKLGLVVPVALALGGLYLGFLEATGRDRSGFRRFKWAVGTAAIVAAAIVAFRPTPPAVVWDAYSDEALAAAKAAGRPVVLDFSAEWCVPCHELDQNTFTDPAVVEALGPFTRMKVDLTRFDSDASIALRDRYAIAGVPSIVFLGPDGTEFAEARVVGFLAPDPFLKRVRAARAAAQLAER